MTIYAPLACWWLNIVPSQSEVMEVGAWASWRLSFGCDGSLTGNPAWNDGRGVPYCNYCLYRAEWRPYGRASVPWRTVDYGDEYPLSERTNALAVDYAGWDVLSIQTLSYMGVFEDYLRPPDTTRDTGIAVLQKIVATARRFFLAWDLTFDPRLDQVAKTMLADNPSVSGVLYRQDFTSSQADDQTTIRTTANHWTKISSPTDADWTENIRCEGSPHWASTVVFLYSENWWADPLLREVRSLEP